jgi:GT2 family glycosyltransferase
MIVHTLFFAVIVLYNRLISDSLTYRNLLNVQKHDIKIIVADNSTIKSVRSRNQNSCFNSQMVYLSMNGNKGLSKAYNRILDILKGNEGFVVWFDDDTDITQNYFDELEKQIFSNRKIDIFAPVIMGQDGKYYSPNEARLFKNKQLKKPSDSLNMKKFNAINSCTAVNLDVYSNYRYDERIFLDQVDHNFFEDQRNLSRVFCKLNVIIHHNFSLKSKKESPQECWARYKIMIPDFLTFCNRGKVRLMLGILKVIGWGVRESCNYRYPLFLWWCFSYGVKCIKAKGLFRDKTSHHEVNITR